MNWKLIMVTICFLGSILLSLISIWVKELVFAPFGMIALGWIILFIFRDKKDEFPWVK
jgi:hypothetical protein